jgi:hypothetical protein
MDKNKQHYITLSNKIRRKTISVAHKLYNNNNLLQENVDNLEHIDFLFSLIEDKIKEINMNIKNPNEEKTQLLKKKDINKLLPIFCYYLYYEHGLNNIEQSNSIDSID